MFVLTFKFNRKTAVFIVIMAALLLIGIVLLAGAHSKAQEQDPPVQITTVKNERSRQAYLAQYGWEVDTPALSGNTVVIPRTFSDVFQSYNDLQKQQGFDLAEYCGLEVELYTYKVTNYGNDEDVIAQMYIYNNCVIGGDVHSTRLDGFMVGIKPGKSI